MTDLERTRPPPLSVSPDEKLEQRFFSLRHLRANDDVLPLLRSGAGAMANLENDGRVEYEANSIVVFLTTFLEFSLERRELDTHLMKESP